MKTKEQLIAFEDRVAQAFRERRIKAPVHLSGGNEEELIDLFKEVRPQDWVFSTWRSHYHALLKGIPEEWVFGEILAGRSMYLMNAERRFFCSSIVGGILPIACGVAMGIKRKTEAEYAGPTSFTDYEPTPTVWVFVGDMAATTGLMHEFLQYARGHELPVRVFIEDNGLSTNSVTKETWGRGAKPPPAQRYTYERKWPHVGIGERVQF